MKFSDYLKSLYPGLLLVFAVSVLSFFINEKTKSFVPLESVTIAIFMGMTISNLIKIPKQMGIGFKFCSKKILQYGIILLGFKLNFSSIINLGYPTLIMILTYTPLVILLAYYLGKIFKINNKIATLIGVGSGICGASAIVAMSPVIKAKEEESIIAVSIVNFLGAIGVLCYSLIATQDYLSIEQYGVWSGISLQGVAHALAAAFSKGIESGEIGTIVKMGRVLMLVPIALFFSFKNKDNSDNKVKVKFPNYVLFFVLCGIINSIGIVPTEVTFILGKTSSWCILLAMSAMGLSVRFSEIKNSGLKSLLMGSLLFIIISFLTFFIIVNLY